MTLSLARAFLLLGLGALVFVTATNREKVWRVIRDFFNAETHPVNLAVFRIGVFGGLFFSPEALGALRVADFPEQLHFPPAGLGWLLAELPINGDAVAIAYAGLRISCVFAVVGLFTRVSATASVLLGFYVLGVAQLFGKVNHTHHLLWFGALLAASPSGDALSFDSFRRRIRSGPSRSYALPIRFAWLLMGVIYFFPGFMKLWTTGFEWILSDNVKNRLYAKWFDLGGWTPAVRVDQAEWLLVLSALFVIAFELSFIFMIFHSRLRYAAAASGLLFHNATNLLMRIPFWALQLAFVSFVDWHALGRRIFHRTTATSTASSPFPARVLATSIVGGLLLASSTAFGVARIEEAWPIAAYPSFHGIQPPHRILLRVEAETTQGTIFDHVEDRIRPLMATGRFVGLVNHILSVRSSPGELRDERMRALWSVISAKIEVRNIRTVRFYRERVSTAPATRGVVLHRERLYEYNV